MSRQKDIFSASRPVTFVFILTFVWLVLLLVLTGNAVAAIQGLTVPMVDPASQAYMQLFWFSVPFGVLGIGLIMRGRPHHP